MMPPFRFYLISDEPQSPHTLENLLFRFNCSKHFKINLFIIACVRELKGFFLIQIRKLFERLWFAILVLKAFLPIAIPLKKVKSCPEQPG